MSKKTVNELEQELERVKEENESLLSLRYDIKDLIGYNSYHNSNEELVEKVNEWKDNAVTNERRQTNEGNRQRLISALDSHPNGNVSYITESERCVFDPFAVVKGLRTRVEVLERENEWMRETLRGVLGITNPKSTHNQINPTP